MPAGPRRPGSGARLPDRGRRCLSRCRGEEPWPEGSWGSETSGPRRGPSADNPGADDDHAHRVRRFGAHRARRRRVVALRDPRRRPPRWVRAVPHEGPPAHRVHPHRDRRRLRGPRARVDPDPRGARRGARPRPRGPARLPVRPRVHRPPPASTSTSCPSTSAPVSASARPARTAAGPTRRRQTCRTRGGQTCDSRRPGASAEVVGGGRRVAGCWWCTPCGRRGGECCCGPKTGSGPPPGAAGPCAPPGRIRSPRPPPHWRRCTPARPPRSRSCSRPTPAARWRPPSSSAPHPVPHPAGHPSCGRGPCPPSPSTRRSSTTRRRSCATAPPSRTCGPSSRSRTTSPAAATCCRPWTGPASAARARWRPVVQGIDQAAVEALVATMPPVARAERRRHARTSPPTRPRSSRTRSTSWSTGPSATGSPAPVSRTAVGRAPSTPG